MFYYLDKTEGLPERGVKKPSILFLDVISRKFMWLMILWFFYRVIRKRFLFVSKNLKFYYLWIYYGRINMSNIFILVMLISEMW